MRLITWNDDEVKVNCFIIPDISGHLTFKMSLWPTFYGHHYLPKIMSKWIDLHDRSGKAKSLKDPCPYTPVGYSDSDLPMGWN